jgi:hypothetical protein
VENEKEGFSYLCTKSKTLEQCWMPYLKKIEKVSSFTEQNENNLVRNEI